MYEKLVDLPKVTYDIPKQSYLARCPALELLCSSLCDLLTKKFWHPLIRRIFLWRHGFHAPGKTLQLDDYDGKWWHISSQLARRIIGCSAVFFNRLRQNRQKLPGTKFTTTVLCTCSNTCTTVLQVYYGIKDKTLGALRRVPWATQTFAEGSAVAKRLKNTGVVEPERKTGRFLPTGKRSSSNIFLK